MASDGNENNGPLPSMPDLFRIGPECSLESQPDFFQISPEKPKVVKKPKVAAKKYDWKKPLPEKSEEELQEALFVKKYFNKVKTKLCTVYDPGGGNKFQKFVHILNSFDPYKETPSHLYQHIEKEFGKDYPDICEEFVLFLTGGQAAQVGKFMERMFMEKMWTFIQQLNVSFGKRPTVLRKVLRCLATCSNSADLTVTRDKILPLLKSNASLTQMFVELLPDQRPEVGDLTTSETILSERSLFDGSDFDIWEYEDDYNERRRKLEYKNSIDTVYLQGRIFLQRGRLLRAAKATYPDSTVTEDNSSQEAASSQTESGKKPQKAKSKIKTAKASKKSSDIVKTKLECDKIKKVKIEVDVKNDTVKPGDAAKLTIVKIIPDCTTPKSNKKVRFNIDKTPTSDSKSKIKKVKLENEMKSSPRSAKRTRTDSTGDVVGEMNNLEDAAKLRIVKDDNSGLKIKILRVNDKCNDSLKKVCNSLSEVKMPRNLKKPQTLDLNENKQIIFEIHPSDLDDNNHNQNDAAGSVVESVNWNLDESKAVISLPKNEQNGDSIISQDQNLSTYISSAHINGPNNLKKEITATDHNTFKTQIIELNTGSSEHNSNFDKSSDTHIKMENNLERDTISIEWTREEDKAILELLKIASVCDTTFNKIQEVLPHRSIDEIKKRFVHVIHLVHQMALGEG